GAPAGGGPGDPTATIDTAEPRVSGPQFGSHGAAPADLGLAFVSQACADAGEDRLPTRRRRVPVRGCRGIGLADMVHNTRTGVVEVDHDTSAVTLDQQPLTAEPAERSPLTRLYLL